MALFGYLTTHAGTMKTSVLSFLNFYLGKLLAVVAVCMTSSLLGRQLVDENGNIGSLNIHLVVNLCMIATGIWFLVKWIRERTGHRCSSCHHCSAESGTKSGEKPSRHPSLMKLINKTEGTQEKSMKTGSASPLALAVMGAGYGISPCAPLLMMAAYAATLTLPAALLVGIVFALATAFVPTLVMMVLTGVLSSRLYREIPRSIDHFRLLSYLLLILLFAIDTIRMI